MAAGEDLRTLGFNETEKITTQMAKTRFKKLAKETHPDRPNGDKEEFQRLQSAFIRVLRALEAETRSPEGSTHCMSCYMAVMDAWREKKENGVAGQVCFNIEENKTFNQILSEASLLWLNPMFTLWCLQGRAKPNGRANKKSGEACFRGEEEKEPGPLLASLD